MVFDSLKLLSLFVLSALIVAVGAWWLTRKIFWYLQAQNILDHPNERSSHTLPTPRGGGIAIVAAACATTLVSVAVGWTSLPVGLALCVGGAFVAWIGWQDDKRHVSASWRVVAHGAAAIFAVLLLGGFPTVRVDGITLHVGLFGSIIAVLGIVWAINFYNFMDGIDGIASVEGVLVGLFGAAILMTYGSHTLVIPSISIAAGCAGFLPWNWSPAKLFMGDVGSGFIGYWFAVLAVASEDVHGPPALLWIVLLGVFVFDSTITLLVRLARSERIFDAHRTHAYQRAVQCGLSHASVTKIVGACTALIGSITWWIISHGMPLLPLIMMEAIGMAILYAALSARYS